MVSINVDGAVAEERLDLLVGKLGERILEFLVKAFLEGLAEEPVVGLNSVLDVRVFALNQLNLQAVQLILDVILKFGVAVEDLLVSVDEAGLCERILH